MNGQFYEQLGGVAGLFEQWGACERTVVACALARRVPWPGLRLLQRAVEAALRQHGGDARLESHANDDAHLAALLADDDEDEGQCQGLLHILLNSYVFWVVRGRYSTGARLNSFELSIFCTV